MGNGGYFTPFVGAHLYGFLMVFRSLDPSRQSPDISKELLVAPPVNGLLPEINGVRESSCNVHITHSTKKMIGDCRI